MRDLEDYRLCPILMIPPEFWHLGQKPTYNPASASPVVRQALILPQPVAAVAVSSVELELAPSQPGLSSPVGAAADLPLHPPCTSLLSVRSVLAVVNSDQSLHCRHASQLSPI